MKYLLSRLGFQTKCICVPFRFKFPLPPPYPLHFLQLFLHILQLFIPLFFSLLHKNLKSNSLKSPVGWRGLLMTPIIRRIQINFSSKQGSSYLYARRGNMFINIGCFHCIFSSENFLDGISFPTTHEPSSIACPCNSTHQYNF